MSTCWCPLSIGKRFCFFWHGLTWDTYRSERTHSSFDKKSNDARHLISNKWHYWTLDNDLYMDWCRHFRRKIKSREIHFFFNVEKQRTNSKDSFFLFLLLFSKTGRSAYKMTIRASETNIVVDLRRRKKMTRLMMNDRVVVGLKEHTNCFGITYNIHRGASLSPGKYVLCEDVWCWSIVVRLVGGYAYVGQKKTRTGIGVKVKNCNFFSGGIRNRVPCWKKG